MVHAALMSVALALFNDVNRERQTHGLPPVVFDARLSGVATDHASDMAKNNYFAHESPSGQTPFERMKAAGCEYHFAAENIAMAPSERVADRALFASAPHRTNTLNLNYTRVGIGVATGSRGELFFVEDFSD
jgi:uncharacterized protein YkwD